MLLLHVVYMCFYIYIMYCSIYLHTYMCLYKFGRGVLYYVLFYIFAHVYVSIQIWQGGYPIAMKVNSVYGVSAMGDAYVYESMYMEPSLCSSMRCLM